MNYIKSCWFFEPEKDGKIGLSSVDLCLLQMKNSILALLVISQPVACITGLPLAVQGNLPG